MPNHDVETTLCEALEAAGRDYEQAVRQIEALAGEIAAGGGEQTFAQLEQIVGRTRRTEADLAIQRDNWRRIGKTPGSRLQAVLARQEGVLRRLITVLDEAEQIAHAARSRLAPIVDSATRSHQMHTAYARAVRQAAE